MFMIILPCEYSTGLKFVAILSRSERGKGYWKFCDKVRRNGSWEIKAQTRLCGLSVAAAVVDQNI